MLFSIKELKVHIALLLIIMVGCQYNNLQELQPSCDDNPMLLLPEATATLCGQSNGMVVLTVSGGQAPYTYQLGDVQQDSATFTGLAAGKYQAQVTDANGCMAVTAVTIETENGITASATSDAAGCGTAMATLTVSVTGGTEPYSYALNNGNLQDSPVFTSLPAGMYSVMVTDAAGCDFTFNHQVLSGVSYAQTIKPIIMNNCAVSGCHNGTQFPDFRSLSNIQQNKDQIRQRTQTGNMPPNGRSLTQQQIDLIACWIDDGALDN